MKGLPPWLVMVVLGAIILAFPFWASFIAVTAYSLVPFAIGLWPLLILAWMMRWYLRRRARSRDL